MVLHGKHTCKTRLHLSMRFMHVAASRLMINGLFAAEVLRNFGRSSSAQELGDTGGCGMGRRFDCCPSAPAW